MRVAFAVVLFGCVPQPQPTYFQQPGYQQPSPGQQPYGQQPPGQQPYSPPPQVAQQASCSDTLACYGQCNPLTEQCIGGCDQRTSPAASQNAHAVLQCMAQSGCTDQNCVAQRCGTQITTCTNTTLPQTVAQQPQAQPQPQAGGSYDLVYQTPAGWTESRVYLNAITLGFDKEDFYDHQHPRIHVFPSRPRQGAINAQFMALWNELVVAPGEFTPGYTPGPLRRRTTTGYAMALDGNQTTLAKGGSAQLGLYVIYTDDKVVPILATGVDWNFEKLADAFFNSLTIRGSSPSKTPLFDTSELVGHWSTQAVSVASYVNSSGGYVGDASIATADGITLEANGAFKAHFVGVGRGMAVQEDDKGKWTIEDDMLVLSGKRTDKRRIWGHGTAPKGNPDSICLVPYGNAQPRYFSPEDGINSSWYGKAP
jgi:hypothetical protein